MSTDLPTPPPQPQRLPGVGQRLDLVDDGTLMGVISFLDVAKAVLEEQSFENKMLKNYIRNWPDGEPAKG